jgi:hypothetical protein
VLRLLILLAQPSASGGEILEARLEAKADEGRDVVIRLAYRIEAPDAPRIAFSALEIDGVAIEEFSAFSSEAPLPLRLEPRSGPKREGFIAVPEATSSLELRYVVRGGADRTGDLLRVRLPVAVLDLPIEGARTGLFHSAVDIPGGLSVVDGFPSHSTVSADGSHRWELPVVPTFVAFRAASETVLLTAPRVATTAVVLLLVAMGFVGLRGARASRP